MEFSEFRAQVAEAIDASNSIDSDELREVPVDEPEPFLVFCGNPERLLEQGVHSIWLEMNRRLQEGNERIVPYCIKEGDMIIRGLAIARSDQILDSDVQ